MFEILHKPFLVHELKDLLPRESFAWLIARQLGSELVATLESISDEDNDGYWESNPAEGLYDLLSDGWILDCEWFEWTDGSYKDDSGANIPDSILKTYSASEQMAAFGLYLATEEVDAYGKTPTSDIRENDGQRRDWIIQNKAENLLFAYQALVFAQKLLLGVKAGTPITMHEVGKAMRIEVAKDAANRRHSAPGGSNEKRAQVREIWASGKYTSRDICAEQECAALGMSFSTARKALRNTPDIT